MATPPQPADDFFGDGKLCSPCFLDDCDGDQSKKAPSFQGGRISGEPDHHPGIMEDTEGLLADALNKLSVRERSKAEDDVHCIASDEVEVTPELIEESLAEFERIVQTVQTTPVNRIYTVAVNQNRSYVEARSFRLMFLWANDFNVSMSVDKMMRFLEQKALWFGEEKVAQDIGPEDMNEEEIALMRSGLMQVLKDRDQSGRVILYASIFRVLKQLMRKTKTLIRVVYHIVFNLMIAIPQVQTKGIVMLVYDESKGDDHANFFPGLNIGMMAEADKFLFSLPFRISSLHLCLYSSRGNLTLFNRLFQVSLKAVSKHALTRTRIHYGSNMERQYRLQTFGIPLDHFPVDKTGKLRGTQEIFKTSWCDEYLRILIRETDVLLGRGGRTQVHVGNLRFREFLQQRAGAYDSLLSHNQKYRARIDYLEELISSGTRFFRQTETRPPFWVRCDLIDVEGKIGQFFRTLKKDRKRRRVQKREPLN